ncbi:hypothetical protein TNCV_2297221 [Trichonephila clavipes]|nr:hypothetical protein TNCV_2297221 [Trichonephila clavipes]
MEHHSTYSNFTKTIIEFQQIHLHSEIRITSNESRPKKCCQILECISNGGKKEYNRWSVPSLLVSAEVPGTQGYEKRCWFDNCPGTGENDSREDTGSFQVQSGRGRKRVNSMIVEEVATAVQEESSGGLKP